MPCNIKSKASIFFYKKNQFFMKKQVPIFIIIMLWFAQRSFAQTHVASLLQKDTFQQQYLQQEMKTIVGNADTVIYTPAPSLKHKFDSTKFVRRKLDWVLYYDFYTTLTALHHINSQSKTEVNNLYFYYNIDIKNKLTFKKVTWDFYLFNDYGVRHFFDSLTIKTQDQFTLKHSFYVPIYKNKLYLSVMANTQTKLFQTHDYRINKKGVQERYLLDGFMSPGIIYYTGGITYAVPHDATINVGLGSSKVTKIKNQEIFTTREVKKINGLEKGTKKKSDFGITATITVPMQQLNKHVYWEMFGNSFVPFKHYKDFHYYTIDANNVLHFMLLKYVRLSLRTKLMYAYDTNPKPVIQHQMSLGFYLTNQL
jgi:hypothetical protein